MDELDVHRRRSASPPPLWLPLPPDDLLVEILLRLPPEPIHFLRASLVSKHWRRLVHDARFLRRFRAHHGGAPPLLGFFNNQPGPPLFVPTTGAFAPPTSSMRHGDWWAMDCRQGRALLESYLSNKLLVWDLVTGNKHYLPLPPACREDAEYNGAVLCAANHHHRGDCRSYPFLVVFVFSHQADFVTSACVYSSETSIWGVVTSIAIPRALVTAKPTVLIGRTLYWLLDNSSIIEFHLDNHRLGITKKVPHVVLCSYSLHIVLMPAEDGQQLGFAGIEGFNLHMWSRVAGVDGVVTWIHRKVIDLKKFLVPKVVAMGHIYGLDPIGLAEDANMIFFHVEPSVYMINLKSMQCEEVLEKESYFCIFPYTSFYAPGVTIGGADDQAELSNNI